jgi:hypothetical protein
VAARAAKSNEVAAVEVEVAVAVAVEVQVAGAVEVQVQVQMGGAVAAAEAAAAYRPKPGPARFLSPFATSPGPLAANVSPGASFWHKIVVTCAGWHSRLLV